MKLEDLKRGAQVKGVEPNQPVTVIDVQWHGTIAVELVYKRADGRPATKLLYRDDEPPVVPRATSTSAAVLHPAPLHRAVPLSFQPRTTPALRVYAAPSTEYDNARPKQCHPRDHCRCRSEPPRLTAHRHHAEWYGARLLIP